MHKTNFKYYSALFTLAGLLFSLVTPTQSRISADLTDRRTNPAPDKPAPASSGYGNMPLLFEANMGQTDSEAKFISRGKGYTLYLAEKEAVFSLKTHSNRSDVLRMQFAEANLSPTIAGLDETITKTNYYKGRTRIENVSNFGRVAYKELYKGINAVFYGNTEGRLEYDFVVAPGANTDRIGLKFDGAKSLSIDRAGDLIIKTPNAKLVQPRPFTYQEVNGERREVSSRYVIAGDNTVKFETGDYDRSLPLTIDPAVQYLTYIGGNLQDTVSDVDADAQGNAYITGEVNSLDYPVPNSRQAADESGIFVTKISPNGQTILFNTFLDGSRPDGEFATSIAVSPSGDIFIAGTSESDDYPTTPGSYQPNKSICLPLQQCLFNSDVVVTRLNNGGNILYSTYLGGAKIDTAGGIAVDFAGRAYVTGDTTSGTGFPKKNEFQSTGVFGFGADAFLTVFNADGTDIIYSSGLGGNSTDRAKGIALDQNENVYITGVTGSNGTFPIRSAFQTTNGGGKDVFVAKFNPFAVGDASLIYSTFVGGGGTDEGHAIAVNSLGQAHITGITGSFDFPLQNALRSTNQVNEAFVTVLGSSGSQLVNSSFLGGADQETGTDIAVLNDEVIFIAGETTSGNFPVSRAFQPVKSGGKDGFVTKLRFGTGIMWSSFIGGNGLDFDVDVAVEKGFVYVTGGTESNNLATTPGVLKATSNAFDDDTADGFLARIRDTHIDSVGVFRPASTFVLTQSTTTVVPQNATFTTQLNGAKGVAGDWDGDSIDSIGTFTNGTWKLRNVNFPILSPFPPAFGIKTVTFGATGDLPVSGDWNGDGIDTPGIFRSSTGQFILTDSTGTTPSIVRGVTKANFGTAGDLPISGDWDGDGKDSIAVYRPGTGETFFTNDDMANASTLSVTINPGIDFIAFLGIAEDLPFAGDWNGDGKDSLGLWRPSTTEMILSDDNINLRAVFPFGQSTDQPIAGDWDALANP